MLNKEDKMIRKLSLLTITTGLIACLGNDCIADGGKISTSQWDNPTIDQLMDFLDLDGGNITFNFASPVYLNIYTVTKNGEGHSEESGFDYWTDKPSTNYQLCVMVEDVEGGVKRIKINYKRAEINNPKFGVYTSSTSGGYGLNFILSNAATWRAGGAWRNRDMDVSLDEPIILYELTDDDAPSDNYNKLIVRFSESRPPKDE